MGILLNFPPPEDGIHHQEPNTVAYFGDKELGKGILYITENKLCWISNKGEGFSLEYSSIFIHAVSKDLSNFPHECLFLMIDNRITLDEVCGDAAQKEADLATDLNALRFNEEDEDEKTSELRFVPENKNMLDVMFRALADCQALNPDPEDASDEDSVDIPFNIETGVVEEEGWDEEEDYEMNEDQFEDAED